MIELELPTKSLTVPRPGVARRIPNADAHVAADAPSAASPMQPDELLNQASSVRRLYDSGVASCRSFVNRYAPSTRIAKSAAVSALLLSGAALPLILRPRIAEAADGVPVGFGVDRHMCVSLRQTTITHQALMNASVKYAFEVQQMSKLYDREIARIARSITEIDEAPEMFEACRLHPPSAQDAISAERIIDSLKDDIVHARYTPAIPLDIRISEDMSEADIRHALRQGILLHDNYAQFIKFTLLRIASDVSNEVASRYPDDLVSLSRIDKVIDYINTTPADKLVEAAD